MKAFLTKNFALVLAFLLPIVLIAAVAFSTYLPSQPLPTGYNFVYAVCTDGTNYSPYPCTNSLQKRYTVTSGTLAANEIGQSQDSDRNGIPDIKENYTSRIFLHDTKKNESREITLEDAQVLKLNSLLTSLDGVTVSGYYERNPGFFLLFDGNSSYGYYLMKGKKKSRLNLINSDNTYYYSGNFQFIGWVTPAST